LPLLKGREALPATQEKGVQDGSATQVCKEDEVLSQGGHPIGREPERGDARQDGPKGHGVHQKGANHQ